MNKLTTRERKDHEDFLRRQQRNEKRYSVLFYNHIQKTLVRSSKAIQSFGAEYVQQNVSELLDTPSLLRIFQRLYNDVCINEAIAMDDYLGGVKNIFWDILEIFSPPAEKGGKIRIWREVVKNYTEVQVLSSINEINQTTVKRILGLIQQGIDEGMGPRDIGALIRRDVGYTRYRSVMIARTETITAANQGKMMAAHTNVNVLKKGWIPTIDNRTRSSHRKMENTSFLPLDSVFMVDKRDGSQEGCQYPGDEALSGENRINCRCSLVFRPVRDGQGRVVRKF